MEYPPVASLRARRVFCPKPPCVGIAGGADRARRRSTRRKSRLGRGRRNKRRYLGRDHRGYVRGSDQLVVRLRDVLGAPDHEHRLREGAWVERRTVAGVGETLVSRQALADDLLG